MASVTVTLCCTHRVRERDTESHWLRLAIDLFCDRGEPTYILKLDPKVGRGQVDRLREINERLQKQSFRPALTGGGGVAKNGHGSRLRRGLGEHALKKFEDSLRTWCAPKATQSTSHSGRLLVIAQ